LQADKEGKMMRKLRNAMFAVAVVSVGAFGAGSLFAQEEAKDKVQPNDMHGHMMGEGGMMSEGGMHGNMMGQMHSMTEKCNAMMDTMQKSQAEGAKTSA
jgi:hypothetical protein